MSGKLYALLFRNFVTDFPGSNLTKSSDNLAVFRVNQRLRPFIELFYTLCSKYDKLESVFYFFQTIFNGNSSHKFTPFSNFR